MVQLKNKIIKIDSEIDKKEKNKKIIKVLTSLITFLILFIGLYLVYYFMKPYINAVNINKIVGKKVFITECNTKDYIIIGKDKSYSLSLTNKNCEKKYYEGDIIIKDNTVIFNENIVGIINNDFNIAINNNIFKSEKNE